MQPKMFMVAAWEVAAEVAQSLRVPLADVHGVIEFLFHVL